MATAKITVGYSLNGSAKNISLGNAKVVENPTTAEWEQLVTAGRTLVDNVVAAGSLFLGTLYTITYDAATEANNE